MDVHESLDTDLGDDEVLGQMLQKMPEKCCSGKVRYVRYVYRTQTPATDPRAITNDGTTSTAAY